MSRPTSDAHLVEPDRQVAQLRIPPQSIEAECCVLGGLLLDNSAWDRIGDLLLDRDFYRHEHRIVFNVVGTLINSCRPADVVTVYSELQKLGKVDEVGGLVYLNSLAQYVPSAANIRRYAEIVRERSLLRQLISVCDESSTAAFNPLDKPVATILDEAAQKVMTVGEQAVVDEWEPMDRMLVQELDLIQNRIHSTDERPSEYIPTGFRDLDDMLDGGMRAGQLIVIGSRPSMGKSAMAHNIGTHVAGYLGLPVGAFSMEMQNRENGQRALSAVGSIPMHALRRPERMSDVHWTSLTQAIEQLRQIPFYSNDRGGLNINQIRAKARALKRKHGLRLLIVDYLQLMSGTDPRVNRTGQLEEASRGLKSLAKELGVPVIALAQVKREVEKALDPMPTMSDLKDCGSIEQDADVILFLHRPIVLKPNLGDEWKRYCKAHLAKQRGGRTGLLHFRYVGEHTRFEDWPLDQEIPTSQVVTRRDGGSKEL